LRFGQSLNDLPRFDDGLGVMTPPSERRRRAAHVRARWAAHAGGEAGDTMIEVMVAALLVALIAGGVLMGFGQVASLSGGQRQRAQATALAQQDQARLRGLPITQLAGTAGNQTAAPVVLDGTSYVVTSKSAYVTGTGAATCVAGQTGTTADEVAVSSSVTWSNIGARPPVVLHSILTPPVGGSVVISATTPTTTGTTGSTGVVGLAGMTATLAGPTTTIPLTTDSTGCAIFGGLTAGGYTLSLVPPTGYVDVNGNTTVAGQTPTVTATQTNYITAPTIPTMAQPGTITASFTTVGATGATGVTGASDQFSVQNTGLAQARVFGTDSTATNNTFATTVSSGATVYPTATPLTSQYTAEPGGCVDPNVPTAGQTPVAVTSGQTATPTLPEPALIILPYTSPATPTNGTFDDTQAAQSNPTYSIVYSSTPAPTWVTNTNTGSDFGNNEHDDSTAGNTATFTFYGTGVTWIGTRAKANGTANVTLDGVAQGTFDEGQSSSTSVYQAAIHTWSGLTLGSHTLVITVNGAHSLGNNNNVSIDEFTYTSSTPAVLMTTKPNVIVTDTDSTCGNNPDYPPTQIPTTTGGALQFPGLPWGTYTVCVDNGTTGGAVHDTVTGVNNSSYTSGNPLPAGNLPVTLYSGGVGTYGTGPCQTTPTSY
jgi:hypothetical protein